MLAAMHLAVDGIRPVCNSGSVTKENKMATGNEKY